MTPRQNHNAGWKGTDGSGESATKSSTIPTRPKLKKRFYEALVLLSLMNTTQGERIEEKQLNLIEECPDLLNKKQAWRSFLKSLAYLCDAKRGGSTVTALLAKQTPQGVVLWIASNKCSPTSDGKTFKYLESILHRLVCLQAKNALEVKHYIEMQSLDFCSSRLEDYRNQLKLLLQRCMSYLEQQDDAQAAVLKTWLEGVNDRLGNLQELCRKCYSDRHSLAFEQIYSFTGPNYGCTKDFMEVRHVVGRLGQNIKAAIAIVHVALRFPELFGEIRVERRPSSRPSEPPLYQRNPTLSGIIGRVTSDVAKKQKVTQVLVEMDELSNENYYSKKLEERCQSKNWKPLVHAELILLSWAHTQQIAFVDGDKYIACSKPACYCCYLYILEHPGCFAEPACHNNVYLNWRAPDIVDGADKCKDEVALREYILNQMARKIRENAIQQILERRGPRDRQHGSVTGISSNSFAAHPISLDADLGSINGSIVRNMADGADQPLVPRGYELTNPFKMDGDKINSRVTLNDINNIDYSMPSSCLMTDSYGTADGEVGDSEGEASDNDGGVRLEKN